MLFDNSETTLSNKSLPKALKLPTALNFPSETGLLKAMSNDERCAGNKETVVSLIGRFAYCYQDMHYFRGASCLNLLRAINW